MIVRCEKCLEKIGERPPYGGVDGWFDFVVVWDICPDCQLKWFETPEIKATDEEGEVI